MVMNYETLDTYFHMVNHYKLVNSAKSVVNTSPPKSYLLRQKNNLSANSRCSTNSLLSKNECVPSKTNSYCDLRQRKKKVHNCLPDKSVKRSSSVPPKPVTRRNSKTISHNLLKENNESKIKIPLKIKIGNESSRVPSECNSINENEIINDQEIVQITQNFTKNPIPTPRRISKTIIPDYEYLQFSLRITEDIIRNDLYSPNEMQRVFNSHLEANRGRLSMTKMHQQIDHLCRELNFAEARSRESKDKIDNSQNMEIMLRKNSKILLKKIRNQQDEKTDEEMHKFGETEKEEIISGMLDFEKYDYDSCSANLIETSTGSVENQAPKKNYCKIENKCNKLFPNDLSGICENDQLAHMPENFKKTQKIAENNDNISAQKVKCKPENKSCKSFQNDLLEISKKYKLFDNPENIKGNGRISQINDDYIFENVECKLENERSKSPQNELLDILKTELVDMPKNLNGVEMILQTNDNILVQDIVTGNENVEDANISPDNNKFPMTSDKSTASTNISPNIKYFEVGNVNSFKLNQVYNDTNLFFKRTEDLNNMYKSFQKLNDVQTTEEKIPSKEMKNTNQQLILGIENSIIAQHSTDNNLSYVKFANQNEKSILCLEEKSNLNEAVSIQKNEITQTPFSIEIAQFFENLPHMKTAANIRVNSNKDILNVAGHSKDNTVLNTRHANITTNSEQICSELFKNSSSSGQVSKKENSFIRTVNSMILNKMNCLFEFPSEPLHPKDDVLKNKILVNDYSKYEIKKTKEKCICDEYKKKIPQSLDYSVNIHNGPFSSKISEVTLSEGEISKNYIFSRPENTRIGKRTEQTVLKELEKYEHKKSHDRRRIETNTSINRYELNNIDNCKIPIHRNHHKLVSNSVINIHHPRYSTPIDQESLLSDGEVKCSSESDGWKTDSSENSDRK